MGRQERGTTPGPWGRCESRSEHGLVDRPLTWPTISQVGTRGMQWGAAQARTIRRCAACKYYRTYVLIVSSQTCC